MRRNNSSQYCRQDAGGETYLREIRDTLCPREGIAKALWLPWRCPVCWKQGVLSLIVQLSGT